MHSLSIFALALFLTSQSFADSSCWPEEQLIGKRAQGFIEGINFKLQKVKSLGQKAEDDCRVETFTKPEEKLGAVQPCKNIQCIKGECGDGGDYTSIPIESHSNSFIQVTMKDGKKAWLKLLEKPEIKLALPVGKVGTIFPSETKILVSPNGKPVEINLGNLRGLTNVISVFKALKIAVKFCIGWQQCRPISLKSEDLAK